MYPVEFVDDFERTIRIELAGELLVEFVCQEETCPITFTIPPDAALGSS